MCGEEVSPMKHLRLARPSASRHDDQQLLQRIADECLSEGVAVTVAKYLPEENLLPPPRYCNNTTSKLVSP